ncbi:MAG: TIM-barrel domain-containing protein [Actinomycetota bacterium]
MRRVAALAIATAVVMAVMPATHSRAAGEITLKAGPLTVTVTLDPFAITFSQEGGAAMGTAPQGLDPTDPTGRTGPLGFAVGASAEAHELGYHLEANQPVRWFHAKKVTAVEQVKGGTLETGVKAGTSQAGLAGKLSGATAASSKGSHGLSLTVETDDPLGREFTVRMTPRASGVIEVQATLSDTTAVSLTGAAFERSAGEHFLGLGERSDGADQTGRVVTTWSEEGPFAPGVAAPISEPIRGERWQGPEPLPGTNFPMPWFASSRGYGFLLDSTWLNEFSLAADRDDVWSVATREPALRYRVYAGPTPAKVLERFTSDVGRQPAPARWFFGPWYQAGVDPGYWRSKDVPVTVAQTYTHYLPCGAQLSTAPDKRRARTAAYHASGYKVTTYVNSFVCYGHPGGAYEEGDANGYFIKTAAGQTYPAPYVAYTDAPWHGIVDFTNPAAASWWQDLVREALDDGYDGWMEDFGEYVPVDSVAADGRTGLAYHNDYCNTYHRASHELTWARYGSDFASFVRCGYAGTARYARLVWGGDPSEDWSAADGLAAAVSQGESMGLSGVGYWGSDIGGFHAVAQGERTSAELLTRWLEFGAFSGIMRTEKDGWARPGYSGERAQVWDPEVQPVWRKFAKLRTQLYPYVWEAAQEYQETGMPIMRHLALAYPSDSRVYSPEAEYEFMFGPDLLVAPVIEEGARSRAVYLPAGRWVNFWDAVSYDEGTGAFDVRAGARVYEGGKMVTVAAPLDQIPLFVREGACLTLLPPDTDTLAEVGNQPGLVHLSDTAGRWRTLSFGGKCASGSKGGAGKSSVAASGLRGRLPATGAAPAGAALAFVLLAAALRRRGATRGS